MTEPVSQRPSRISTLAPIAKGQTHNSFDDAVNAARKHASEERFSYKVKERNKQRAYLCCTGENCPAYVRVHLSKKTEFVTVSQFNDEHVCQGSLQGARGSQRDHEYLVSLLEEGFPVSKDTKPKDVQTFLQQKLGMDIPYATAHKAKEAVLNESSEAQREQFQLLRGYAEKLVQVDPTTYVCQFWGHV